MAVTSVAQPSVRRKRRQNPQQLTTRALAIVIALIWLGVVVIPLAIIVIETFKTQADAMATTPWSLPNPTLDNFQTVLGQNFWRDLFNSAVTSVCAVLLSLFVGSLAAYALARIRGRINGLLYMLFVAGLAVPVYAAIIPIYQIAINSGLYDSLIGLILPLAGTSLPVTVFILAAFMRAIPDELELAMSIDGAGYVRRYFQLVLPLARPALATVAIFTFIGDWNNFIFPLVLTTSEDNQTLPLATANYQGQYGMNVPLVLTVVVLSALPLIVFYLLQRRNFIQGLTMGALTAA
jgi:ABC-type glycerol-3-phosphate transport system permease component